MYLDGKHVKQPILSGETTLTMQDPIGKITAYYVKHSEPATMGSYIGKERQLLSRIERERAELNSHEPDAWRGNYQMAADEIKLLRAGDYVREASGMAADAIAALDQDGVHVAKHLGTHVNLVQGPQIDRGVDLDRNVACRHLGHHDLRSKAGTCGGT